MKNVFKTLSGLIYSAVFLLLIGVGITWKVYFWDSEVLNIDYREEETFHCGVTEEDYPIIHGSAINFDGLMLNQTGQALFKDNCHACHDISENVVGPALKDITLKRKREWIHNFVKNSQSMIAKGDTAAVNIFTRFDKQQMPSFNELTTAEIGSILDYITVYSGAISDIPYPVE